MARVRVLKSMALRSADGAALAPESTHSWNESFKIFRQLTCIRNFGIHQYWYDWNVALKGRADLNAKQNRSDCPNDASIFIACQASFAQ